MKSPRWIATLRQWSACTFATWPRPHPLPGGSSHSARIFTTQAAGSQPRWEGVQSGRSLKEPNQRSSPGGPEREEALEGHTAAKLPL